MISASFPRHTQHQRGYLATRAIVKAVRVLELGIGHGLGEEDAEEIEQTFGAKATLSEVLEAVKRPEVVSLAYLYAGNQYNHGVTRQLMCVRVSFANWSTPKAFTLIPPHLPTPPQTLLTTLQARDHPRGLLKYEYQHSAPAAGAAAAPGRAPLQTDAMARLEAEFLVDPAKEGGSGILFSYTRALGSPKQVPLDMQPRSDAPRSAAYFDAWAATISALPSDVRALLRATTAYWARKQAVEAGILVCVLG